MSLTSLATTMKLHGNWYMEVWVLKSMDVTHSPACREVLIASGVSILNDSEFTEVFKVLRSRTGLHRLLGLGSKNSRLQKLREF